MKSVLWSKSRRKPIELHRQRSLLQAMMHRRIKRGASKISLIDQGRLVFAMLKDDKLVVFVEFGHCLQQMPGVPADSCGLMIHQPGIDANAHTLPKGLLHGGAEEVQPSPRHAD